MKDYGYQSRQQLIHKPAPVPVVDTDILAERAAYENKLHEAIKYLGERYILHPDNRIKQEASYGH